ncbi:acyl-CoA dehydrogenase [Bacillus sp. CH30_1T]|uniref:acyl-CoA dehydrogenase family protein n=1 Tax=Bacillus sp. CH30_1T TaxID=2604836 RepID=UPI0011EFAF53|nr:acyl-CoA dehydrogenase family protein [Bacillus sp. CH30_1T]KAA0563504.1 acyl-CoA dehydrogenase [Bacillus sp. CH30_1T]
MNFSWNEEQLLIRNRFSSLSTTINSNYQDYYDRNQFDDEAWEVVTNEGIWKYPVPEKYGGYGKSWWEFTAALEGLASTTKDLGFLLSMIAHIGCLRVLMKHGTEEQKHYYLDLLMNGKVGATAITETSGGSDVARISTSAAYKSSSPSLLELNGHKSHITNAPIADVVVMVGRIPELGKKDITLFILERDMTGLTFGERENMFGNRTSPTGDIYLKNVHIHKGNILGEPGDGLNTLYNMISLDRLLYGLIAAAFIEPLLTKSLAFSNDRTAFKTSISNHQYIQKKLTDMKMNIEKSRWVSYAALDRLITGHEEASLLCSIAKFTGTEALVETAHDLMLIHGHQGYMQGEISQILQDAIGTRIAGGTSDIQRVNIFNQLQKLHSASREVVS